MSKQKKLKRDELTKAKNLIANMYNELEKFTETNINVHSKKLEELKKEEQHLKINGNVINEEIGMAEYLENQKRLKELPIEISELQGGINLAKDRKEEMTAELSLLVYKQTNDAINKEFDIHMCELQKELFEHFKEISKIVTEMTNITDEYTDALMPISGTRGVYIDMSAYNYISPVADVFNVNHTGKMGFGGSVIMPQNLEEEYKTLDCSKLKGDK